MFDKFIGNKEIKTIFERLIKTNRVPHSLLFTGTDGIGKKRFALEIAKSFVCKDLQDFQACGICPACKRSSNFAFPKFDDRDAHKKVIFSQQSDIGMVIPYRNNILVTAIRELEIEANFLPYESKARIFVINDADKMNDAAANALLKTLEEPAETTFLFLITSRPSALLPTILSRCQTIRFAPIKTSEIETHLLETKEYSADDAKLLAKLSRGSIANALKVNLEDYYQQRFKMLDVLRSLTSKRNITILIKTAEELCDPKRKYAYKDSLKILETLIHDIWTVQNNPHKEIINFDILQNIEQLSEATNNQTLSKWLTELETLFENLTSNLNRKIATDALFMQMASR